MCDACVEWGGKKWHVYGDGYYERTDKSVRPKRTLRLHRERWLAEVGPIPPKFHVHHKDENKANNDLSNLECIPVSEHLRGHLLRNPRTRADMSKVEPKPAICSVCEGVVYRKVRLKRVVCARCTQRASEERRKVPKQCRHCGADFVSRAGNFCSQRCVNLATVGATVRVLPEGVGRT